MKRENRHSHLNRVSIIQRIINCNRGLKSQRVRSRENSRKYKNGRQGATTTLRTEIECSSKASRGRLPALLKRSQLWLPGWQRRLWEAVLVELAGNLLSKVLGEDDHREISHWRYSPAKPPKAGEASASCWLLGAGGHWALEELEKLSLLRGLVSCRRLPNKHKGAWTENSFLLRCVSTHPYWQSLTLYPLQRKTI